MAFPSFHLFGKGPAEPQEAAIAAAVLRSDRFRQEREGDWKRLEAVIARLEAGRIGSITNADLLALPALYRGTVASLSIARETSLDTATLGWLEALVERAWFQLYGPRQSFWIWLRRFLGGEWPAAVRAIGPELLIALAVMIAGTLTGWLLCAGDPGWYYALVPGGAGDTRVPGASRAVLLHTLFDNNGPGGGRQSGLGAFAAYLFGNNAQVAILAFALGFAFGIPPLLLLVQNTGTLGAMLWLYHGQGLTLELAGWLAVHGTTELFAILLAGGAGLHIGRAIAFPGDRPILASAAAAGQRAATVMAGVGLMLLVAACLEGFARQLVESTPARLAIGSAMLALWCGYFFAFRRGKGPA